MLSRSAVVGAIACLAISAGLARTQTGGDAAVIAKARAIHERVITLDTHVDIGANYATPQVDPGKETTDLKCTLPKMEKGGLKGVFLAVFVGQSPALNPEGYEKARQAAMAKFEAIGRLVKMYPDRATIATSPDEVRRVAKTGRRAILIGIENGYPIGQDLGLVKTYFDLGARYITLAHSGHNQICDSASPPAPMHNGLSEFGKKVVAEMNRLGIMVDVSHISPKSYWDVIAASKAPIIASHSGAAAITPVPRNLDDEQLRALAKNGGVIQVVALGSYLKAETPERRDAVMKLRQEIGFTPVRGQQLEQLSEAERAQLEQKRVQFTERMKEIDAKYPTATLKDFADHLDHAAKVAGIDHVGVGTDFDGGGGIPGFNDHSEAFNVTLELVRRGYSEKDIEKIWGGNLLRVWEQVIKVARGR